MLEQLAELKKHLKNRYRKFQNTPPPNGLTQVLKNNSSATPLALLGTAAVATPDSHHVVGLKEGVGPGLARTKSVHKAPRQTKF